MCIGVTSFSIDMEAKKVTVVGDVTPLEVLASVSKVKNAQLWQSPKSYLPSTWVRWKINMLLLISSLPSPRLFPMCWYVRVCISTKFDVCVVKLVYKVCQVRLVNGMQFLLFLICVCWLLKLNCFQVIYM